MALLSSRQSTYNEFCIAGKNGVYCDLVKNVREAFEECELARINCQGMNGSDYRKIGAKLKVENPFSSMLICVFHNCSIGKGQSCLINPFMFNCRILFHVF